MPSWSQIKDNRQQTFRKQVDENHALQQKITQELHELLIKSVEQQYNNYGQVRFDAIIWRRSLYISEHHLKPFLKTWLRESAKSAFRQSLNTLELAEDRVGVLHAEARALMDINSGWYAQVTVEDADWSLESNLVDAVVEIGYRYAPPLT